jgi:hypothetical protein
MEKLYETREYAVFHISELDKINFKEVLETSPTTIRMSIDLTKSFVKWDGDIPQSVLTLTSIEGPYTHLEMLALLSTLEWMTPNDTPPG